MKHIGLLLLIVGIALCAAFGGRTSPAMYEQLTLEGQAVFRGGTEAAAFENYCTGRSEASLPFIDGCVDPDAEAPEEAEVVEAEVAAAEEVAEPTYEELLAVGMAHVAELRATPVGQPSELAALRTAWIDAMELAIEPSARLATTPLPGPSERFSGWLKLAGVPFFIGLALLLVGSIIARRGVKAEAAAGGPAGTQQVDFRAMLITVTEKLEVVHAEMATIPRATNAHMDATKAKIEALQLEELALMVEARNQLQNKVGLAGFAAVFSPFSMGERRVNRTWSTLSDYHWGESVASVGIAIDAFKEASAELAALG